MSETFLMGCAVLAAFYHVAATILIYDNLRRRGIPVNFVWLRLFALTYAGRYRRLTVEESGRTGPLFYHWVISINAALVLTAAGILAM